MAYQSSLFNGKQVNTMAVKRVNEMRLLQLLYREGELTNQELREKSGLSLPTITQAVQKFRQQGFLADGEELESSGGRPSKKIAFQYDAFHCVGVEIRPHHVEIVVTNLTGRVIDSDVRRQTFENAPAYWRAINTRIKELLARDPQVKTVLGVGIAFPGEVSINGDMIRRATLLGLRDEALDNIKKHFDFNVYIDNGAYAAGFGAIWRSASISDAVYILIPDAGVAGTIILDNQVFRGGGKAGAFGHTTIFPQGKPCSCGARGCWSAYSALNNLSSLSGGDLDLFFAQKDGDPALSAAWDEYLSCLAQALRGIILSLDLDVIIGGKLVRYLRQDLDRLQNYIREVPVLRNDPPRVRLDDIEENTQAVGAALIFVGRLFAGKLPPLAE